MAEQAVTVWPTPPWIPAGSHWQGAAGRSTLIGPDGRVIRYWIDANWQPQPERLRVPCSVVGCSGTVL